MINSRSRYYYKYLESIQDIYSNFSLEADYGEHALIIGKHLKKKKGKKAEYQYALLPTPMRQVSF